jgi:gas vesicle protein
MTAVNLKKGGDKNMSKSGNRFALGTLIAAAVGYVTGILTAPKSGKETRQDIQDAANKAKVEAERKLKALHSELNQLIDQGKEKAGNLKSKGKTELDGVLESAKTAREKARDLLSALHEGDADDKDLQKAVKDVNRAIDHLKKYLDKDGRQKTKK